MKTVIFVGGTARSGSTLLDLILANDPKAMSLGEIHALFRPTRKHHFNEIEKLKKDKIWLRILKDGKRKLYPNLIKYFLRIDILVDSSKDPFWFIYHQKFKNSDYNIKNVLIYKSPEELANSFIKRGQGNNWIRTYKHYHKKYFSLIESFITISYKDLVTNELALKKLCEFIGITYFESKKNYWEREQPTFFGSNSAKFQKENINLTLSEIEKIKKRKSVIYDSPNKEIIKYVADVIESNKSIHSIYEYLSSHNILRKEEIKARPIRYNAISMLLMKFKRELKFIYKYLFPEEYFKQ